MDGRNASRGCGVMSFGFHSWFSVCSLMESICGVWNLEIIVFLFLMVERVKKLERFLIQSDNI